MAKTAKTGQAKINAIAKKILSLTAEDFAEARAWAERQQQYMHPLKHATARKINRAGDYNMGVIAAIEALQVQIKEGHEHQEIEGQIDTTA